MRLLLILFALLLVATCQARISSSDADYREIIIGTWSSKYPEENGISMYGEKTYNADGTASGHISIRARGPAGLTVEIERTTFSSKWKVEEGILESFDVQFSDGERVDVIRDKIISISRDVAEYEASTDGSRFVRHRIR